MQGIPAKAQYLHQGHHQGLEGDQHGCHKDTENDLAELIVLAGQHPGTHGSQDNDDGNGDNGHDERIFQGV